MLLSELQGYLETIHSIYTNLEWEDSYWWFYIIIYFIFQLLNLPSSTATPFTYPSRGRRNDRSWLSNIIKSSSLHTYKINKINITLSRRNMSSNQILALAPVPISYCFDSTYSSVRILAIRFSISCGQLVYSSLSVYLASFSFWPLTNFQVIVPNHQQIHRHSACIWTDSSHGNSLFCWFSPRTTPLRSNSATCWVATTY